MHKMVDIIEVDNVILLNGEENDSWFVSKTSCEPRPQIKSGTATPLPQKCAYDISFNSHVLLCI